MSNNDNFIKEIYDAGSLEQLHHSLTLIPDSKPNPANSNSKKLLKKNAPVLIAFLIGLVVGIVVLYTFKVNPLSQAAEDEHSSLQTEKEALEASLDKQQSIVQTYESVLKGDSDEVYTALEDIDDLNEPMNALLLDYYLDLESPEGYQKAAELGDVFPLKTVKALRKADSDDANEAILSMEADNPEVMIEKAWLNEDYKQVIEVYKDLSDNSRAKFLAGKSYIELKKPKKAMKIGKDLGNKEIQMASLKLQKKEVKADDDLKGDKKDDKLDDLDDKIDKLK